MNSCVTLAIAVLWASLSNVEASGGQITASSTTDTEISLQFKTTLGYSYQVQTSPTPNNRFWSDALPPLPATGSLTSALAPRQGSSGFYRVLEFTNLTFWYDWQYYYEAPCLNAWGLGTVQNSYAHTDRPYDWYIDQADTGVDAGANCGPSSVTMGIKWYQPSFTNTAEYARNTFPENNGWWATSDIVNYLNLYSIPNTTSYFTGPNQLQGLLDQGNLVILCINTGYLTQDFTSEHRIGKFYSFGSGHFIVVKGYRVVDGTPFFEVYDPNNWHEVYADNTPKGRNRHFLAGDLANAIANWWNYLIVIAPPPGGQPAAAANEWLKPVDPKQITPGWGM